MKLTDEEEALRAGAFGWAAQWAIEHQIKVGRYLGARDFVAVSQAHVMADTESLGATGVEWLEHLARLPAQERRVRVPTITDPRGTDFAAAHRLKQQPWMLDLERRAIAALEGLGLLMTNTCINYQTVMPPLMGEHVAYGDTGVVIYCNSVCGARSNFEGGPSALAAALRLPPRGAAAGNARGQRRLHAARAQRLGRAGWHRRPPGRRLLAGSRARRHRTRALLRRNEAFRRGARELRLGRAVPYGRHHSRGAPASRCSRRGPHGAQSRGRRGRYSRLPGELRRGDRGRRRGRVLGAAVEPHRDCAGRRHAGGTARTNSASRRHQPAGERRRRSHGVDRRHRGGRRHRAQRHVLLPELCPGDGGGEWLAAAGDEFGQARQHHRRLRLSAGAHVHAGLHRRRVQRRQDRAMSGEVFFAAAGMGQKARGQALVAKDGFSARYDLDRLRGVFSRSDHKLAGEGYVGRVLVLDAAKGGVATAWMLHEMKARGVMPAALVLNAANPIMVQGAAFANFTMISGFDCDITKAIPNGAEVEVDPTGERPFIRVV